MFFSKAIGTEIFLKVLPSSTIHLNKSASSVLRYDYIIYTTLQPLIKQSKNIPSLHVAGSCRTVSFEKIKVAVKLLVGVTQSYQRYITFFFFFLKSKRKTKTREVKRHAKLTTQQDWSLEG